MACRTCKRELASVGIEKERDFKIWAARGGHPDKGGDNVNFQKISRCVDMVYKENCRDEAESGRGNRSGMGTSAGPAPGNGGDEVDAVASMLKFAIQALASCRIVGLNVESSVNIGRAGGSTTRPFKTLKRTINLRLKHKRIFGIPLVPWHNVQVGATFARKNARELQTAELYDIGGFSGLNAGVSWRALNDTLDITLGGMLDAVTDHPQRPFLARYTATVRWNCLSHLGKSDRLPVRMLSRLAVCGGYIGRCDSKYISDSFRLHEEVVTAAKPGIHIGLSVPIIYLGAPKPWVHVFSSWGPRGSSAEVKGEDSAPTPEAHSGEENAGPEERD